MFELEFEDPLSSELTENYIVQNWDFTNLQHAQDSEYRKKVEQISIIE